MITLAEDSAHIEMCMLNSWVVSSRRLASTEACSERLLSYLIILM